MDREEYIQTMKEVFAYLQDYDPLLEFERAREYIADLIWHEGVPDSGNTQTNYEHLRNRVETMLEGNLVIPPGILDWWPE